MGWALKWLRPTSNSGAKEDDTLELWPSTKIGRCGCHLRHIRSTSGGGSGSRSRRWVPRSPCFSQCLGEASALPQSLRRFQAPTSLFQSNILQATSVLSVFVRKGMGKVKAPWLLLFVNTLCLWEKKKKKDLPKLFNFHRDLKWKLKKKERKWKWPGTEYWFFSLGGFFFFFFPQC